MPSGAPPSPTPAAWLQPLLRLFGQRLWLLALLTPVALAGAAHLWLPQAPSSLGADAIARSAWLNTTAAALPAGSLLSLLGLLDLAHNLGLRILIALLAATLVLRLFDAIHLAWATRRLAPPERWLPGLGLVERQQAGAANGPGWEPALAPQFERWQAISHPAGDADAGFDEAFGDRNHRFSWAAILIELGLLLALLALSLDLRGGWQIDGLSLDPGQSASMAPFGPDLVRLDEAGDTLALCCRKPVSAPLAESLRLVAPGLRLSVQQVGPALSLSAQAEGQVAPLQAVEGGGAPSPALVLRFPTERAERAVALPDRNLFLRLVALPGDQFSLQALDDANHVLLTESLAAAANLTVGEVRLQVRPGRYAVLSVVARPWQWLLVPALLMALAGLLLRWRFPYVRGGLRLNEGGAVVRWQGQRGGRPGADDIAGALAAAERDQLR
jgi:hypothetical protein